MSPEEIQKRWTRFVVPDIKTVHSKPLYDAIKDLRFLLSLIGEFSKEVQMLRRGILAKRHQPMSELAGKVMEEVKGLREENKVLKNELAAVEDALKDAIRRTKA